MRLSATPTSPTPAASTPASGLSDPLPGQAQDGELTSTADPSVGRQVVLARVALAVGVLLLLVAIGRELTR